MAPRKAGPGSSVSLVPEGGTVELVDRAPKGWWALTPDRRFVNVQRVPGGNLWRVVKP